MLSYVILEWHWGTISLAILTLALSLTALLHLLTHHRDHRSAAFWFALILLSPLVGACLYGVLGINFVRRKGRDYRGSIGPAYRDPLPTSPAFNETDPVLADRDCSLAITLDRISRFHFAAGNAVGPLINGDEAMPAMLQAIHSAQTSVSLSSYIFEAHHIGADFVTALAAAHDRGVQVRVIVDDAGTRYSWPPVTRILRKKGVPVRRFMPNHFILRLLSMNLRNHKKILIVDGHIGFTGGMNIREGNMISRSPSHPVRDLHFRITGPVVGQMQRVFAEDWHFCSGELIEGPAWFPQITPTGETHALGIVDGPDEDLEVMPVALFAALNAAHDRVCIMTPYFLPTTILMAALKLCASRGIAVTIITPAKNNIPFVAWAARTLYPELLEAGCRIYESQAPFDHSKLLLIDNTWSCIGSTNWDPRSLRLNFEFNLACRSTQLSARLQSIFDVRLQECTEVTPALLEALPLPHRLRNGFARLFIPVL
ncbi:cardiolipin synthase [Prosthecobacter fusiformis]|uniref:Cardiolipin synthase n=1 Tax=Prosthecobacter fusiformis TaxID=48464 RepID=A0A4R7S0T6_9BACT|nr:phospholipase D-like domain-containing protein [Prosthecobacter fusiformis]TDU71279.1 cardiolipin synthase [Prosthecobacter fusiformis]